jgi:hypothetical protein
MVPANPLSRIFKLAAAAAVTVVAVLAAVPGQAAAAGAVTEPRPSGMVKASAVLPAATTGVSANKLCGAPPAEAGNWVNADPNASGIARIELRNCQSVVVCNGDICSITHDAGWATHVFGKCSPTNCDWGWSPGAFPTSSGQVYGFFDQGFAKRYVYAKMSAYRPGQLWVHWRTDFTDPSRADYDVDEWFVRA